MAYDPIGPWNAGASPALSPSNLDHIEQGITDAHDLIVGGGGRFLARGSFARTVAASSESQAVKDSCDYVCDGTDDEVQINQAIDALSANTIGRGTQGGTVILIGRLFSIASPILIQTQVRLTSLYGKYATVVQNTSANNPGTSGGMIELFSLGTQYTQIDNLTLSGQGVSCNGIYQVVGTAFEWDAFHTVEDLYIFNVGGDGLHVAQGAENLPRNRGNMYSRIRIIEAGRYGVHSGCPDSFYIQVDTGSSGSHGFNAAHANNRYVNCKAWYSDGDGFRYTVGRDNQTTGCESQDNQGHGFYVSSPRNSFSACCADSNGYTGTGDGFFVIGNGTSIAACTASEKGEHTASQRYGIQFSGTPKVLVNLTTSGNTTGASTGATAAGSVVNVVNY
jgi:hypothetical protein